MGTSCRSFGVCAAGLLAFNAAWADESAEPAMGRVLLAGRLAATAPTLGRQREPFSLLLRNDGRTAFSVVEVATSSGPLIGPPQRSHHALSFASDAPRRWLRSVGIVATGCSTRVRFPSRVKQTDAGVQTEVAAHVMFACLY